MALLSIDKLGTSLALCICQKLKSYNVKLTKEREKWPTKKKQTEEVV